MTKRGPKPKPTAIRMLDGNPSRRPLPLNEPTCAHPPVMPATVGADSFASAEWTRIRDACPPNLFTAMDAATLAQYCLAWSMLVRSQEEIDTRGLIIETPIVSKSTGDIVGYDVGVNPAARTWKAAGETMLKCVDRLGLTPTSRTRIQVPTKGEVASKFDGLLGRHETLGYGGTVGRG